MSDTPATRVEKDSMGEMEVPADALYGATPARVSHTNDAAPAIIKQERRAVGKTHRQRRIGAICHHTVSLRQPAPPADRPVDQKRISAVNLPDRTGARAVHPGGFIHAFVIGAHICRRIAHIAAEIERPKR